MSPIVEAPIVGHLDDSLRGRDPLHGELRTDSTIRDQVKRGTGLINDELYIGRLVWNRLRCVKNPEIGKRVSRVNPREEWIVTEVPEFRIVDDELSALPMPCAGRTAMAARLLQPRHERELLERARHSPCRT